MACSVLNRQLRLGSQTASDKNISPHKSTFNTFRLTIVTWYYLKIKTSSFISFRAVLHIRTHGWLGEAMQWQPISEGARRQISADDIQTV